MRSLRPQLLFILLWGTGIVSGLGFSTMYDRTPGVAALAPRSWPAESSIPPPAGQALMLLFLHPHCPCSRASLHELSALLEHNESRVKVRILLVSPAGAPRGWGETSLRDMAANIRGTTVTEDIDGAEAGRFAATTSGHAVLYGRDGGLMFQGGITASRGHVGDNQGIRAIAGFLGGDDMHTATTPTFGCPLFGAREQAHCHP